MHAYSTFLAVTYSAARSALRLYFEPLLWIKRATHQIVSKQAKTEIHTTVEDIIKEQDEIELE